MAIADDLKDVVEELFNQFSSTVTITPLGSQTTDDMGEVVNVDGTSYSAQAILDSFNEYVRYFTDGRPVAGADVVFILKTDNVIHNDDTITYDGVNYRIALINPIPITNTNIVYLVSAFIK